MGRGSWCALHEGEAAKAYRLFRHTRDAAGAVPDAMLIPLRHSHFDKEQIRN